MSKAIYQKEQYGSSTSTQPQAKQLYAVVNGTDPESSRDKAGREHFSDVDLD